jgi:dihydroorotate dehydrogenase
MYSLLKIILFRFSPERAHHLTTRLTNFISEIPIINGLFKSFYKFEDSRLEKELWGLKFKNPVGLAAGFDKDGKYIKAMSSLGFGFIEVGTVTPRPQTGNPKPRLFRLVEDEAVINRMGFNNEGVDFLVNQLKKLQKSGLIIGGNIGKNKDTLNEDAYKDYLICFEKLYPYVDYFVVNISSPNTPGLRSLQEKEPLRKILSALVNRRKQEKTQRPILLKIAPDLTEGQLDDVIEIVEEQGIEGIIATNTTIRRSPLTSDAALVEKIGNGGLSGRPVQELSTEVLKSVHSKTSLPLIGVGGIDSGKAAIDKIQAGASLIQVYSGLIYKGPSLVKSIKKEIVQRS